MSIGSRLVGGVRRARPMLRDTIGAVGVSGAPGQDKDEACARAGIAKVADQLK